ncbi:hypothetical protein VTI74DRAFT_5148 [Chaetomium olivicolor]
MDKQPVDSNHNGSKAPEPATFFQGGTLESRIDERSCGMCHASSRLVEGYRCRLHFFCDPCLQRWIRYTLKDPSVFPPRCCAGLILPRTCSFYRISRQYSRPGQKSGLQRTKTYCANPQCSVFISTKLLNPSVKSAMRPGAAELQLASVARRGRTTAAATRQWIRRRKL